MQWCRLYSEVVDDDKLSWVADQAQTRRVVVLGIWAGLLAIANRSDPRGCIALSACVSYTPTMLAHKLDCDPAELQRILDAMVKIGLLEEMGDGFPYVVVNFNKRNYESDDSAPRVKRHREKESAVTVTADERYSNAPEQNRTEQSRTETETNLPATPAKAERTPRPRQRNGRPPDPDTQERRALFAALARVCGLDQNLKRGQLNAVTKLLADNGYNAAQVTAFPPWWGINDWRGKKGQRPTLAQLVELLPQAAGTQDGGSTATIDWSRYESGEYAHLFAED